jgi:hypothetical protein
MKLKEEDFYEHLKVKTEKKEKDKEDLKRKKNKNYCMMKMMI